MICPVHDLQRMIFRYGLLAEQLKLYQSLADARVRSGNMMKMGEWMARDLRGLPEMVHRNPFVDWVLLVDAEVVRVCIL